MDDMNWVPIVRSSFLDILFIFVSIGHGGNWVRRLAGKVLFVILVKISLLLRCFHPSEWRTSPEISCFMEKNVFLVMRLVNCRFILWSISAKQQLHAFVVYTPEPGYSPWISLWFFVIGYSNNVHRWRIYFFGEWLFSCQIYTLLVYLITVCKCMLLSWSLLGFNLRPRKNLLSLGKSSCIEELSSCYQFTICKAFLRSYNCKLMFNASRERGCSLCIYGRKSFSSTE